VHEAPIRRAEIRFYEELNDFLPPEQRKRSFETTFHGTRSVLDLIQALGVPHTEIDVILVDGESVGFDHRVEGGERIAVYPTFERFDVSSVTRLRPEPLREPRFVCDVHLGHLARDLRTLGFDTSYERELTDDEIVARAVDEHRIVLTRDRGILERRAVTHGHWIRTTDPEAQVAEVVRALDLKGSIELFTRCRECNGELEAVARVTVHDEVPPKIFAEHDEFTRCSRCRRVYWRGSHYDRMRERLGGLLD
jgi:hypothetical protein